jgi:uncharacterized membrane protein YgcG
LDRTQYLLDILEAAAHKQHHISVILESKSREAIKARNWLCARVGANEFGDHDDLLKHCGGVHEQLIEVIDAMTKLEASLAKNLKVVLGHEEESGGSGDGFSMFGGMGGFGGGGDS